MSSADQGIPIQ